MLKIADGREEDFRYFQGWLATNAAISRIVEATEPGGPDVSVGQGAPIPFHLRRARALATQRPRPTVVNRVQSPQSQA
jgi:hypothetical protein